MSSQVSIAECNSFHDGYFRKIEIIQSCLFDGIEEKEPFDQFSVKINIEHTNYIEYKNWGTKHFVIVIEGVKSLQIGSLPELDWLIFDASVVESGQLIRFKVDDKIQVVGRSISIIRE
jgi:hypothetical protein